MKHRILQLHKETENFMKSHARSIFSDNVACTAAAYFLADKFI